jgi:hypothetical protein
MSLRSQMLAVLPPFKNLQTDIIQKQGTRDIINYVLEDHVEYETDYDKIAKFFDDGTLRGTCNNLWNFLKFNLKYDAEPADDQTVKSPGAILQTGVTVDCKHYSLFIAGVLASLCRQFPDDGWTWQYCFASDKDAYEVTHVFVKAYEGKEEIWVDPCLTMFDQRKKYILVKYFQPMLSKISGVNGDSKTVDVNTDVAWVSFLIMVQMNFCGIRDIILGDMATTQNQLKPYCISNGFDYDQLMRFVNAS